MFIEGGQEEKRLLIEALSRYNYFPNQRLGLSELPPSFDSRQFTPEVLTSLVKLQAAKVRKTLGYSLTEYRSTRFNNIPRLLGIIHPKAYSHLANCIHENLDEIRKITKNHCSQIKPTFHHNEKRLLVMNYDDPSEKLDEPYALSLQSVLEYMQILAIVFTAYTHMQFHGPLLVLKNLKDDSKTTRKNLGLKI